MTFPRSKRAILKRVTLSLSKGALALSLAACQGSFGSGGTEAPGGMGPPMNPQAAQQVPGNMSPPPMMSPSPGVGASTPGPSGFASFAFSDAPNGIACPEDQGFSCKLSFNVTDDNAKTKAGTKAGAKASASPSASPSPSADPTDVPDLGAAIPSPDASISPGASASPSASSSPSASAAHIMLASSAMPKNAPKMINPDPKAVATVALMEIRLKTDTDEVLQGKAIAEFTLPQEQIGGRGFAVQLFHETVKKKKTSDDFMGTYSQSKLDKDTLRFQLTMPKIQVKKDETWLLVLYGDELPSASASPAASASPNASTSPVANPSAGVSASPAASMHP